MVGDGGTWRCSFVLTASALPLERLRVTTFRWGGQVSPPLTRCEYNSPRHRVEGLD